MNIIRNLFHKEEGEQNANPLYVEVKKAMAGIQAYARSHGGQIHLVSVSDEGEVAIRLTGACNGCPLSDVTLKQGIEQQLLEQVPGVTSIRQIH